MSEAKLDEQIERSIESVVNQIEWLSKRCQLLDANQCDQKYAEWTLEASTLMLQLTRALNELLASRFALSRKDTGHTSIDNLLAGRKL